MRNDETLNANTNYFCKKIFMSDFDYNIIRYDTIDSTNNEACRLIESGGIEKTTVLISDFQTSGKGAGSNKWESEEGKNLTFTVILKPDIAIEKQFYMNKLLSVALCDFISDNVEDEIVTIKWPNDIYVGNNKIIGILIKNYISDNKIKYSVWGVGININQEVFLSDAPNPISLKQITYKTYDLDVMLQEVMQHILSNYSLLFADRYVYINNLYHENLYKINCLQKFKIKGTEVTARVIRVNEYGQLEIEYGSKLHQFDFKEIEWVVGEW